MRLEYKFSYGNFLKFVFSELFLIIFNSFSILILSIIEILVYGNIKYVFRDESELFIKIVTWFLALVWIIYFLYLFIIFFLPKKVVISENFLIIKRYMLNFKYFFRGFNDKVFIKDITECKIYGGERTCLDRSEEYAVFFFDWDDLVEIKTVKKRYLVPVKNAEDFIENVNNRIDEFKNKNS